MPNKNLIPLKNDEVIDFLTWPLTDFSAWKNVFKLQHQFNNIVETSQTTQL